MPHSPRCSAASILFCFGGRSDYGALTGAGTALALLGTKRRGNEMSQQKTIERAGQRDEKLKWSWWYLLFVIQFFAVVWPPFYNKIDPTFIGIPFFYWYQLLWVIIGAVLTAIVYFATEE
jgi:hypothetical protein